MHWDFGPMLSLSRFVHMCVCLCVCVCVLTFEVPFKRIFAPTFQIWMSKTLRDSESLRKSNGKKWSNIWKLLLIKGVKSPGKFCKDQEGIQQGSGGFTTSILGLLAGFFWYRCYYPRWLRDALSPVWGIFFFLFFQLLLIHIYIQMKNQIVLLSVYLSPLLIRAVQ